MAHTSWCSDSVQNPSKCECECNGYLHGIPYFNYSDYKEYEIFNEIHEIHKTDNSNFKDEIKNKIKYISAKIKIDKDILGGGIIKIGDKIIDGSIRREVDNWRKS